MLMADAGEWTRSVAPREQSLDRWHDVLGHYAAAQIALVEQIAAEPAARAAVDVVAELDDELASCGIAETLQHDDLHDGQVFVHGGRHLVMDWGDACISHPFFTLSVALDGVLAWGLDDDEHSVYVQPFQDAYLVPFRAVYDGDLDAAAVVARRLGWACRVVNGHVPARMRPPARGWGCSWLARRDIGSWAGSTTTWRRHEEARHTHRPALAHHRGGRCFPARLLLR